MIQKLELKVGIFLIISSLLIAAAIGYVAYKKGLFAKYNTFTLAAKSGDDLSEGMPVVFSGFKIGTVDTLELTKDGSVLIKIKIPEVHAKWIRLDSTFIVNKPLLGSARIVVVTGNMQSPLLSPEQVPEVVNVSEINETIKQARPLLDKLTQIAGNVERLTARLADPNSDVHKILAHAEKVTANLAQKDTLLEMVVSDKTSIASLYAAMNKTKDITSLLEATLQKIDHMAVKTDDMIYGAEGSLPTVNKALKDILAKLQKLDTTIDNINKISTDAAGSTGELKLLRDQIDATVDSLSELINDVDKIIPFKKAPEIKLP